MKVLLTGSSGWLGRHLAPRLRETGHHVIGLDVASGVDTDHIGSVADKALVDELVASEGVELIVHSGALHKPDIVRYSTQTFVDVNISGTLNLLEAAARAGHDRFLFTSTTSLMVSDAVRSGDSDAAFWMDEDFFAGSPRNIYGVTKAAAENLCRLYASLHDIDIAILRTGRFFPEEDDTIDSTPGPNLKANEFLNRRLTAEDAAEAHIAAIDNICGQGCEAFVISATPAFARGDCAALKQDARAVIARYFPDAERLYAERGWLLPETIDRVYDPAKAERLLGFRPKTEFGSILAALREDQPLPYSHDPDYVSPKEAA